jgi:hypothetical protein
MARNRQWQNLSAGTRLRITVLGIIQVALLVAALWDLRRRPANQINGHKKMWYGLAFINYVGPIAYFIFGRKSGANLVTNSAQTSD